MAVCSVRETEKYVGIILKTDTLRQKSRNGCLAAMAIRNMAQGSHT